jgi:hypothetical protein
MVFKEFIIGKRERMTWIVETGYGAGGAMSSGEVVGVNCMITPGWSRRYQEKLTAGADNLQVQGRSKSGKFLPYTVDFDPVNWRFLKYIMAVSDGTDGAVKTHTFSIRNTILSWKKEWAKRHSTNHVYTMTGNFMKRLTLSFSKPTGEGREGFIHVNAECVAKNESQGSSVTSISNLSKDAFHFRHINWVLNSTEIVEVNGGSMILDLGINEDQFRYANDTLDELQGEPVPGVFRIRGRCNVNIKDKSFYDLWEAGVVVGGTNTLRIRRDADEDDQMLFTFTDFIIHNAIASTNMEGVDNVDIVWTADGISAVARDDIATY